MHITVKIPYRLVSSQMRKKKERKQWGKDRGWVGAGGD